ncbi:MAG: zinc ribbon domain-containing protein [Spirochaetes bacterium]|uniref:Zinc ribbon domain-containing protein n=1 Tax=Candidatus Avitreponema avistercoris TaxID=2840705 RepID=A0A9D9HD04_9SPIR|nr:zinc ribbon domain-containing protein [Candidatus Avitreponema avistercoris]
MTRRLPKFFCENCGAEVRRSDRLCPHCGKFFAAVRCPSCGRTGPAALFDRGCPSCGYAVFSGNRAGGSPAGGGKKTAAGARKRACRRSFSPDPLPLWVYLTVAVLFAALGAVFFLKPPV